MICGRKQLALMCGLAACLYLLSTVAYGEVRIATPLKRTVYQTNETFNLAIIRSSAQSLPGGEMTVTLRGEDASEMVFRFPLQSVQAIDGTAEATEHLNFNGALLRPGKYTLTIKADDSTASVELEMVSHIRQSSFRLVDWGRPDAAGQLLQGADGFGYNLIYGPWGGQKGGDNYLRAGVDYMSVCSLTGGHQIDLRMECDWSDPYAIRGGAQRITRRALADRTDANVIGVHQTDEPGLTWWKNPATGEFGPHDVPAQVRMYEDSTGKTPIESNKVDVSRPEDVEAWKQWATWKLGIMPASDAEAQSGLTMVRPDLISLTQSQYHWGAYTDGYYFNVTRSLPITSGHGGYDDGGAGIFNPSINLELARRRNVVSPDWYMPLWYGGTAPYNIRTEEYLSFITGIQGLITPPELEPTTNVNSRQGIAESNHLMARLGTIFTTEPATRHPVAVLLSLSDFLDAQAHNRRIMYDQDTPNGDTMMGIFLAGMQIQQQFQSVTDEDILDGTVAADHKAIILTGIHHLDQPIIHALEDYAAHGGHVLRTSDCTVTINGAVDLGVAYALPEMATFRKLTAEKKYADIPPYTTLAKQLQAAIPVGQALAREFAKSGIEPVFTCDKPEIAAARHVLGDVEYVMAVNATYDYKADKLNTIQQDGVDVTLGLASHGRPVYDAVLGGKAPNLKPMEDGVGGHFRFGTGELRAFAMTRRPIGSTRASATLLTTEFTRDVDPIAVRVCATVLDDQSNLLGGVFPLAIRLVDPLGQTRYFLYRATDNGILDITLPLAANDPSGIYKVEVEELLANTKGEATFTYKPAAQNGSIAGTTRRAVYFPGDDKNIFRFARIHHQVTLVKGTSTYDGPAAERLKAILEPWGVECTIANAADVDKPRTLSAEEAKTWCGLASASGIKAGDANPINVVGFALQGPAILIGTPEDNPLIKYLADESFLPYTALKDEFPGRGRGYLAWQRDGIGKGQESITAIAYDAAGMSESVGSLFEMAVGLEPLTQWNLPAFSSVAPASKATVYPKPNTNWTTNLPDRITAFRIENGKVAVLTYDRSLTTLDGDGHVIDSRVISNEQYTQALKEMIPSGDATPAEITTKAQLACHLIKLAQTQNATTAIAYWGGTLQIVNASGQTLAMEIFPDDISALLWHDGQLLIGLTSGQVLSLTAK